MSITSVRPAMSADAAPAAAILRAWIEETDWLPDIHPPDSAEPFIAAKIAQGGVLVAEAAGSVAGFLAREGAEISCLYVAGRARDGGLGALLLDAAKAARPGGLWLWTFVANAGARRFYDRHGFRDIGGTSGENEEGLPDRRLHWPGASAGRED
ncbi:MAG: GNAT family N-acetyltransferase [Pseudomonadota bacterium]